MRIINSVVLIGALVAAVVVVAQREAAWYSCDYDCKNCQVTAKVPLRSGCVAAPFNAADSVWAACAPPPAIGDGCPATLTKAQCLEVRDPATNQQMCNYTNNMCGPLPQFVAQCVEAIGWNDTTCGLDPSNSSAPQVHFVFAEMHMCGQCEAVPNLPPAHAHNNSGGNSTHGVEFVKIDCPAKGSSSLAFTAHVGCSRGCNDCAHTIQGTFGQCMAAPSGGRVAALAAGLLSHALMKPVTCPARLFMEVFEGSRRCASDQMFQAQIFNGSHSCSSHNGRGFYVSCP